MRILVFGADGQLGSALVSALTAKHDVTATTALTCNFAMAGQIASMIRNTKPELVVNAAAYTHVDKAESEKPLALRVNADAVSEIANTAKSVGASVIHFSTDYVFDGSGTAPWNENDPCHPLNAYGYSKHAGEVLLADSGVPHLLLRTSWLYGTNGHNFVKAILAKAATSATLRVVDDQIGAPTCVDFLAEAVTRICDQAATVPQEFFAKYSGTYHLAASGAVSWHGFASHIVAEAKRLGQSLQVQEVLAIPTSEYPTPAKRPLNSRLDVTKFKRHFHLTPPDWQVMLDAWLKGFLRS